MRSVRSDIHDQTKWMSHANESLLYVRSLDGDTTRQQLARAARAGDMQRVANGVYVPGERWSELDDRERYLARIRAVADTRYSRPVLSHWSAAAIHGLPSIPRWPEDVHVTIGRATGGRSHLKVRRHGLPFNDDVVEVDGLLVTSIARTVVDLSATASFRDAVAVADRALWVDRRGRLPVLANKEDLLNVYRQRMPFRGNTRSRAVIEFATHLADSPFESGSRVSMWTIGCPRPLLQSRFRDYRGVIGDTDFDWPEFRLVGEADGQQKYRDPIMRAGRSLERVLLDEKERGDRLQAIGRSVSRWGWSIGMSPARLRLHLMAAGLPMGQRW